MSTDAPVALTVTKSQLLDAMTIWEVDSRAGRTLSRDETLAMPIAHVAEESTDHLWSVLQSLGAQPRSNEIAVAGEILVSACHGASKAAGWWNDLHTGEPLNRNVGELLCLIHSEVSEAMEGHRKNKMDDKLPHRPMIEVELADAVIRIADLAGGLGLDLGGAIVEKMAYNAQREDHKVEARKAPGGKAY